jgi:hypothetical protein
MVGERDLGAGRYHLARIRLDAGTETRKFREPRRGLEWREKTNGPSRETESEADVVGSRRDGGYA